MHSPTINCFETHRHFLLPLWLPSSSFSLVISKTTCIRQESLRRLKQKRNNCRGTLKHEMLSISSVGVETSEHYVGSFPSARLPSLLSSFGSLWFRVVSFCLPADSSSFPWSSFFYGTSLPFWRDSKTASIRHV